jgi:glyoxylase-like metal-dependent hydrolase (beta-lactamase superfamily II)/ferredoxin
MADPKRRVPGNAPGDFFVDDTCIDCDTCRQLAPAVFAPAGGQSVVARQPATPDEARPAFRALLACPTASIGTTGPNLAREAMADFPLAIAPGVSYLGYTSRKSFGGSSYLLERPDGNWLVDAPRFLPQIAAAIAARGGLAGIFLTHRDDVADADRYAAHFGARRVIHAGDADAAPGAETVLEGEAPVALAPGLLAIPTPGHTRGHMVLLADEAYLFTGDHLAWDRDEGRLVAFRDACWHAWPELVRSMHRLAAHRFAWVLPGHGDRVHLPGDAMRAAMADLLGRLAP